MAEKDKDLIPITEIPIKERQTKWQQIFQNIPEKFAKRFLLKENGKQAITALRAYKKKGLFKNYKAIQRQPYAYIIHEAETKKK